MTFQLSSLNAIDYLCKQGLFSQGKVEEAKVDLKPAKNFNLLLSWVDGHKMLVKQERRDREGKTAGEFFSEWRVRDFIDRFSGKSSELGDIRSLLSEVLHFNNEDSILVFNYLTDYADLSEFYAKANFFPIAIATEIGTSLAKIHRATFNRAEYQDFFSSKKEKEIGEASLNPILNLGLDRIEPEIFGVIPTDGIKFLTLYQRYDSLGKAISDLVVSSQPCCLTHNDLKLNNILLHHNWEDILAGSDRANQPKNSNDSCIRLIDWERSNWGDPAFDLGTLIASYLQIWLSSLVISKTISIDESLRMATIPLDLLQPSLASIARSYFAAFSEIIDRKPDFLMRVVQFAGFGLIGQIQAMLQYQKSFGNTGICMLQVAKSLLTRPQQSIDTIFGVTESEIVHHNHSSPSIGGSNKLRN
jgi:hypothetical protein